VALGGLTLAPAADAPFALLPMREGEDLCARSVPAGMGGLFVPGRAALPAEDEINGIVEARENGSRRGFPVALIRHGCFRFRGAVDVWAGTQWLSDPRDPAEVLLLRQLLLRSTVCALREADSLSEGEAAALRSRVDRWARRHRLPARVPVPFQPRRVRRVLPANPPVRPAASVVVCNAAADPRDVQVALACLQGLVNRRNPRLYLVYTDHDERWLTSYQERRYVGEVERLAEADAVVARFRSEVSGAVLVDERYLNAGLMLAAVRGAVVCSPALAKRWQLPVVGDLRGCWKHEVEAYRWAFRTLWPQMSHDVLCHAHPSGSPQQLDYLVSHRIFTWFIAGGVDGADPGRDPVEETLFTEALFAATAPHAPVLGWWGWNDPANGIGEYWGMTLASRYAKLTLGTEFLTNMSFHSGIPAARRRFQSQADRLPPPTLDPTKVYVALSVLDSGNDPWYWLRPQRDVWEAPGRGETPTGWVIGPLLLDLAPGIVEWYYGHLTERDELICALSGVGYMNVPDYGTAYDGRRAVLEEYLGLTARYMRRLDLRTLQTYHGSWGEPSDYTEDGDLARYAATLPRLAALFPDVGRHESTGYANSHRFLAGPGGSVPVFHCLTRWIPWTLSSDLSDRPEDREIAGLVEEVRRMTPEERPAFMSAFALSWTFRPEMLNHAAQVLGEPYVFVTPSRLAAVAQQARAGRGRQPEGAANR